MVQVSKREARAPAACCPDLGRLLSPRLFKALADPSRTGLLVRLAEGREPRTVSEAARGSGVDLSVVSRHLAVLREAGVIECVKRGKEVLCSFRGDVLARALRELADAFEACCPPGEAARKGRPAATGERSRIGEPKPAKERRGR